MDSLFPQVPAGPFYDNRDSVLPTDPSLLNPAYSVLINRWCDAVYEESKADKELNIEAAELDNYINYLMGKQWPGSRPKHKSAPVNNRTWKLFQEMIALLTDIRPTWEVKALRKEFSAQATIINTASKSWWLESDSDMKLALVIIHAILSTGFAKLEWNPTLRNGEGEFDMVPLSSSQVFPIKPKFSLQDGLGVVYETPKPLGWFKRKYGSAGALVPVDPNLSRFELRTKNTPSHMTPLQFGQLSLAMQNLMLKNYGPQFQNSGFPMGKYQEFWFQDDSTNTSGRDIIMGDPSQTWSYTVKPNGRMYPRGRVIQRGGHVVLYDGPNPYWHGRFPFIDLRMNIVPWQFDGISDLRNLLPLQDIINNILAGVLDMIKKALNPALIGPKTAFPDSVWSSLDFSMPGAKAGYSNLASNPPSFAQPPNIPAYVLNVLTMTAREMDQSSPVASVAEAMLKRQVPSGDTLEAIRDTQQTPLRMKGRNVEVFMRAMGSMTVSNIFQFYTAKRRFFMMGQDGLTPEDFDYDPGTLVPEGVPPHEHVRNFVFMINPGSLLNANKVQKATLLLNLRKGHDISRATLLKELDLGVDPEKEDQLLQAEAAEQAAIMIKAKQLLGPGGPQ